MRNPWVWVAEPTKGHDYSPAWKHGATFAVFSQEGPRDADLTRFRRTFEPSIDALVLAGPPISIGKVFCLAANLAAEQGSRLKVLVYDTMAKAYHVEWVEAVDFIV